MISSNDSMNSKSDDEEEKPTQRTGKVDPSQTQSSGNKITKMMMNNGSRDQSANANNRVNR